MAAAEKTVEDVSVSLNITSGEASTYGGIIIATGLTILVTSGSMVAYTFITPSPDNMKICEKLIVYNVLIPDLMLGALLSQILGPAIISRAWSYNKFYTQWLAFVHASCVYHAHVATGFICSIISLSLKDVYRFEGSNDIKHMAALVVSSLSLTISFCSLPATEKRGFIFIDSWLGPWFNTRYEYAGYFMVTAVTGLIVHLDVSSIVQLFAVKKLFTSQATKVTQRVLNDLNKVITFTFISLACGLLTLPAAFLDQNTIVVMVVRMIVYICPLVRVVTLLYVCPHFQFGRSVASSKEMDDFANLGEEVTDTTSDKVYSLIEGEETGEA